MSAPATGSNGDETLGLAFSRQRKAADTEGSPSLELRRDRLERLIQLCVQNTAEIAAATQADYGGARSLHMTYLTELFSKIGGIEHSRDHLAAWMAPEQRVTSPPFDATGAQSEVIYQPKGVVGIISPWNLPFGLSIAPLTSALAAGNRAMIKPSEFTPQTSALMAILVSRYFAPEEVTVITGEGDVGAAFARLPFDHLLFTGSTRVGREIMRAAAENLTPVTLELGGKCPVIIGESADMATTVTTLAFGKLMNAGQLCLSPDYALVPADKQSEIAAALIAEASSMYPDPGNNPDLTGIINDHHHARLTALLDDAKSKGAKVTSAGTTPSDYNGRRMPLHVIEHVTPDMAIMQEEIFGPILPIIGYSSLDEALAFVAAREKPLGLYFFGTDQAEEERVLSGTCSGGVTVNDILQHYVQDDLPFGGIGASGMGAYHGRDGFLTFSHARSVFHQGTQTMAGMFRPPFGPELQGFLEGEFARRRT